MNQSKPNIIVYILDRFNAEHLYLNVPYIHITVTEPSSNFCAVKLDNPNLKAALALNFSDIEDKEYDNITPEYTVISDLQAHIIAEFVKAHQNSVDIIVVNCDAGISRSSAIAAAIMEYLNGSSASIWSNPMYHPNSTVYNKVRKQFGLFFTGES